jgi:uncharacterized protein (DUF2062 family)
MNWRQLIERLAGANESPARTAAAFAFGTFLSFSPFLGLQIAAGMSLAFLLRLNRVAVFIGLNMNLPWLIVPWYTLTTIAGSMILRQPIADDFGSRMSALLALPIYRRVFWEQAYDLVAPFFWSFVVGSTIGAAIVGVVAYVVMVPVLARWRERFSRDAQ